jgi:hypothetical protein
VPLPVPLVAGGEEGAEGRGEADRCPDVDDSAPGVEELHAVRTNSVDRVVVVVMTAFRSIGSFLAVGAVIS